MNSIRCIVLMATLMACVSAPLSAMKNDIPQRADSGQLYLVSRQDLTPLVYTDLLECVKSKRPDSLVLYLTNNDVSSQTLASYVQEAEINLTEFIDVYGNTVLHYAAESGSVKAIKIFLEVCDRSTAYKIACVKNNEKLTALHYAVNLENTVADDIIIAILQTASTNQEACALIDLRNSYANSAFDIARSDDRARALQIMNIYQIFKPGSKQLKDALEKKPTGHQEQHEEDDGACKCTLF